MQILQYNIKEHFVSKEDFERKANFQKLMETYVSSAIKQMLQTQK